MSKFHIGKTGQPSECKAKSGKCPLGGEHYESQQEAYAALNNTGQEAALSVEDLERKAKAALVMAKVADTKEEGMALRNEHARLMREAAALRAAQQPVEETPEFDAAHWDSYEGKVERLKDALGDGETGEQRFADLKAMWNEGRKVEAQDALIGYFRGRGRGVSAYEQLFPVFKHEAVQGARENFVAINKDFIAAYNAHVHPFRNYKGELEMIVSWRNKDGGTEQRTYALDDDIYVERGEARQRVERLVGAEQMAEWDAQAPVATVKQGDGGNHRYGAVPEASRGESDSGPDPEFIEALRNMYIAQHPENHTPEEDGLTAGDLLAMFNKGELG